MAALAGFEPTIFRLTAGRSAVELQCMIVIVEPLVGIEPLCPGTSRVPSQKVSKGKLRATKARVDSRDPYAGYPRAKSLITFGAAVSKPTTSSMPASSGSAMVKPFDTIPTTISLAAIPMVSR